MTTDRSAGFPELDAASAIGAHGCQHVLVCTPHPPAPAADHGVDVRPGPASGYDGGRIKLPLQVSGAGGAARVPWIERAEIDAQIRALLTADATAWVRFGDRAMVRRLIGPYHASALEERLAATAATAEVPLLTWTTGDRQSTDRDAYDLVVERATPDG